MTKNVQEYFDAVAPAWDTLRGGFFTPAMRDDAIARANLAPSADVADIGTGTGFVIEGLRGRVRRIVGFDANDAMLAEARRKFSAAPEITFERAESLALPAADASFDAVFANMYLHHTPDPAAAIAEMARLLRPGGRLVITDLDTHSETWMREAMADRWLGFERADIARWFRAAGLSPSIDCAAGTCDCSDTPTGSGISLSIFVAIGVKPAA